MKNTKLSPSEQTIYEDFALCGKNAKKWMQKCILMLLKIEDMKIWEKKGFSSIYEFAAKLAGMSRNKVNEGLRILKKIEGMGEILRVVEQKGIWAVKPILRVLNMENQKFWAEKAMEMRRETLIIYVKDFEKSQSVTKSGDFGVITGGPDRAIGNFDEAAKRLDVGVISDDIFGRAGAGNPADYVLDKPNIFQEPYSEKADAQKVTPQGTFQKAAKITVSMKLDPEIFRMLENLKGTDDWNEFMKGLLESRQRERRRVEEERQRLEVERQKILADKPQTVQTNSRPVPRRIQKFVYARAGGKCESPGCGKPGEHFHHTTPFALKKEHNPDKIRLLCQAHHDIAHYGLIDNEDECPGKWEIRKFPDLMDYKNVINARVAEFRRGPN